MEPSERHILVRIAHAIGVSVDLADRSLYRVHIEGRSGQRCILTAAMSLDDAANWRAHLIAAMVEACL